MVRLFFTTILNLGQEPRQGTREKGARARAASEMRSCEVKKT